jgi:hypothetical protein
VGVAGAAPPRWFFGSGQTEQYGGASLHRQSLHRPKAEEHK